MHSTNVLGRIALVSLVVLAVLAGAVSPSSSSVGTDTHSQNRIRWRVCNDDVTAETGVVYECARLRVPLDYDHPRGHQISLNLVRVPATDPERRLGAILVNPGGPGGSGVGFVLGFGPFLGLAYGPEVAERFDLVGFDPRGVAGSTPIRCFRTVDEAFGSRPPVAFPLTPEEEALFQQADRELARNCASRPSARRIARHMSTANAARDMDVIREGMGDEQLNFLGLSYGAFLGTTYANLFPDRVRSFALDGIDDPIAYVNLEAEIPFFARLRVDEGAQETLERFFELCEAAAPGNCALAPNARDRFAAVADSLLDSPIEVIDPGTGESVVFTYQALIAIAAELLGDTFAYADLADSVASIESVLATPVEVGLGIEKLATSLGGDVTQRMREPYNNVLEAVHAVACADSNNPTDYAIWSREGAAADEAFGYFGRLSTWTLSGCAQWPFDDDDRYVGPFDAYTANPILIIGNLYDPNTRYEGAQTLRSILPNSGLLTVDVPGHTSLGISACAGSITGQYFLNPDVASSVDGQTCPVEFNPFDVVAGGGGQAEMRQAATQSGSGEQ